MANPPAIGSERRVALLELKLRALVRDNFDSDGAEMVPFPAACALRSGAQAWVLAGDDPLHVLGRVLAWGDQQGVHRINILADEHAPVLARRAACVDSDIRVFSIDGRSVSPAVVAPPHTPAPRPAGVDAQVAKLESAGVEVVVEYGIVTGELLGLEVARVVTGTEGIPRIEVGVGQHDREAFTLVHGDLAEPEALRAVVEIVGSKRRAGAAGHPFNRLAAARWLRRRALDHPVVVGARSLEPIEATVPRSGISDTSPAVAIGHDLAGLPLVAAFSVGVDLDLVPAAADARASYSPGADLVLVVVARDDVAVTRRMAASLHRPARIVHAPEGWRGSGPWLPVP